MVGTMRENKLRWSGRIERRNNDQINQKIVDRGKPERRVGLK